MDLLSTLFLSRIKFAFTIGFHILFPTITMGLVVYLFILEIMWLRTGNPAYSKLFRLFSKIFALSFGMGVVTGIPMSFQFATNWGPFSLATSNVIGPLMGFEVLSAFFLEATFLGIMVFGWGRVKPKVHLFATGMVMLGTTLSAYWIICVNAWMQHPQGSELIDGIFYVTDWSKILLNETMFYHLTHMLGAAYLTAVFVVMGVLSIFLFKRKEVETALPGFKVALACALILGPIQFLVGHAHGLHTGKTQPTKLAAMEAHWETEKEAPMILFAWPDMENEKNLYEVKIPKIASWYLTGSTQGTVHGLKEAKKEDRPFVPLVFFSFRLMVGIGCLFIFLALAGGFLWMRKKLETTRWLYAILPLCIPLGFVATIAGWIVTEVGRQPWIIHGLMRTANGVSASLPPEAIRGSLAAFGLTFLIVFVIYLVFLVRIIQKGMVEPMPLFQSEN
jgi:cytochrome bd ubiquinol oxidase subunit I